jgi:D-sedoheptulose 7-phosphate isomerase
MTSPATGRGTVQIGQRLLDRNAAFDEFFSREADRLAEVSEAMARRFLKGGRLLAFGRGPYSTDAQHVSVEFVHPVIVGKRALPALDLSPMFRPWLAALLRPEDIVMGFGPPEGDREVWNALDEARAGGAMTIALPGGRGDYACSPGVGDPFVHQELIEILYHTLWETVHVFLERRELGFETGDAGFLYPFLGRGKQETQDVLADVAASIRAKVAEDAKLRVRVGREETPRIADAALAIHQRVARGGKLILFGNGGSATDANDWAIDCVCPPCGARPIPAISIALEAASITAVANDVGVDVIFLRQLIAHAQPEDVAIGISTSGGSRNIIAALDEARKRKLLTIALLGNDGGEVVRRGLADFPIVVRSDYIPRIQEVQASIYHIVCEMLAEMQHG